MTAKHINWIDGMRLFPAFSAEDERGFFRKYFEAERWKAEGIDFSVRESFVSYSYRGVLRGLHLQMPFPQKKIIFVLQGEVWDVAVDLRPHSPTYGAWAGVLLTEKDPAMLYLPQGFAHGYFVRSEQALVAYLADGAYDRAGDGGICWNDETLAIDWKIPQDVMPTVSQKDRTLPTFLEFEGRWGDWRN